MLGTVAFVGCVHDEKGTFIGVIMDNSEDGEMSGNIIDPSLFKLFVTYFSLGSIVILGSIKGTNYFKCPEYLKGLMVPMSSATKVY